MNALDLPNTEFRALAARLTDMAAEFLAGLTDARAFPAVSGESVAQALAAPLPEEGLRARALDALGEVFALSRAPSPRFYGYVLGSGEPVAALADLLASILNQNVTAWRSAPAAVTIERQVVSSLAAALGCEGFAGSLCGGGSAANLMALAMAREAKLPGNETGVRPGVVYASSEVHMSIPRAMALLGLGRRNLRTVAVDEDFRMDVGQLRRAIEADRAAGATPCAVVA
ncbi:MAG: pyridoxal phosphate-dependent decarboxylase family protein, partial [Steroidobacteraceae bacterium]